MEHFGLAQNVFLKKTVGPTYNLFSVYIEKVMLHDTEVTDWIGRVS